MQFASITTAFNNDLSANQISLGWQGIFTSLPSQVLDFIGNLKPPNFLPKRREH